VALSENGGIRILTAVKGRNAFSILAKIRVRVQDECLDQIAAPHCSSTTHRAEATLNPAPSTFGSAPWLRLALDSLPGTTSWAATR
jgi:hypothetical protein